MIVKMRWRDPTVKWDRLDLDFECKEYLAYGVIQIEENDYLLHSVFTTSLDDHDRVVAVRVPKGTVVSIEKATGWKKISEEELEEKLESKGDRRTGDAPSEKR